MTKFLLSVHVIAAIVAIGPVTVAASMFPATARRALAGADAGRDLAVLRSLHRICRVYAAVGIVVPVFGFATASSLGVLGDAWLLVSIALTAVAAAVLALLVLPRQQRLLTAAADTGRPQPGTGGRAPARLAMYTGTFNLLWAVVTVLMIVRPGSTTGV
ncbi:DUF2269 family protein [Prauserella muralis]|uniref:Uncharacterized protein n=1 Tax=Prauserella muralis TaxID=588067 RepID=A0A2V4AKG4_9PSEU|nr:DUF2269 family protein [Prauserella muralis]PXY20702.1 hypothetical protein BAY60_24545 [Prauserella muralis]TWE29707.1 putative integral membrane protein DUF2269 [Prauserella muralis]